VHVGKLGFGSLPCAALCVQADVSALGKFDFLGLCPKVKVHPDLL
jgi:hypothetical protein